MKSFDALATAGKLRRIRSRVGDVLDRYGLRRPSVKYLGHARQTNYRIDARESRGAGESRFLLRVHWPERIEMDYLLSESCWLRAILEDTELAVPEPVTNLEGDFITPMDLGPGASPVACTLTRWVLGRRLLRRFGPGPGALTKVGSLMARLHDHGAKWKKPRSFRRPLWNWEGVLGPSSPFRLKRGRSILKKREAGLFRKASARARRAMDGLGKGGDVFGLVHGDLIQVNYVFHEGEIGAIDFADCGFGHFLYDMGVTLFGLWGRDEGDRQREAFFEGYREIRSLTEGHESLLDTFIAARAVAMARFVMSSDDPRDRDFAPRFVKYVVRGLERWLPTEQ